VTVFTPPFVTVFVSSDTKTLPRNKGGSLHKCRVPERGLPFMTEDLLEGVHLHLTDDDVIPYSIGFHIPSFRIPENTQVMPVLVVPGTTVSMERRQVD
jgi:hypothetical protein